MHGAFVWARRALDGQKRRFPARAVELPGKIKQEDGSRDRVEAFFQAIDADDDGALSLDELLQSFAVIAEARPG